MVDFWQYINMPSTLNMPEYASFAQGSVENNPSYSSGFQYASVWIYKGCEFVKVTQDSV